MEFSKGNYDENVKFNNLTMNVRYVLAKNKIDELFVKFLCQPSTNDIINSLVKDIQNRSLNPMNLPNPNFTSPKLSLSQSMHSSAILNSTLNSKSPQKSNYTPPRSPNESQVQRKSQPLINSPGLKQFEIQESQQNSVALAANYSSIPQFFFPEGKPVDSAIAIQKNKIINEIFGSNKSQELQPQGFIPITTNLCQLPQFFNTLLFNQIEGAKLGKISKVNFLKYYQSQLEGKEPQLLAFNLLQKNEQSYIDFEDFQPMMKSKRKINQYSHAGLQFLQATPEFQDRYSDTVIHRIFYTVNRQDDGKITWRQFKLSNIFQTFQQVDKEEDINKVRNYFSYEHFYVIYCQFWELDSDHDFLINKEEFSKYSGHTLSRRTVDRIFEQVPRKFKSQVAGKMNYQDFTWFILSQEDKTSLTSIEYWFKVIDLDCNGIISGHEMEHFYEEQQQRLEYLQHETVYFQDIVCQMVDLLKPEDDIKFYIHNFKQNQTVCSVFFNFLTNLNKFVAYEQRDPFMIKHQLTEHPDYTEWDRFAQNQYLRLAMEEENQQTVFDGTDPWDSQNDQK